ncbi:DUF5681 domain-containing protein [Modicisalibacter sp. 'Wilcox']|uniref:DUF5681 domain-containing protein n=1 Tax=Modicisalibacter sp. 'Wilcox' TaxID=2679914 RepID=UPI0013D624C9|nr:DUF5681 domain-containing protein [Modicisalibacter sp. 'Wilcox']
MAKRDNNGRFVPGQSGNPSGRPSRAAELRKLLDGDAEDVARKVAEAAKGGDLRAAELVLARCVPVHRPSHAPTPFDLDRDKPLADQGRDVLAAIASGELPPDTGKHLLDALTALARVAEIDELQARMAKLEEELANAPQ